MIPEPANRYNPDYAVPPGAVLVDLLESLGISQTELARRTGFTKKHIHQLVHAKVSLTPETALALEKVLPLKADIWLKIEQEYRLFLERRKEEERLRRAVAWSRRFPLAEMRRRGLISASKDSVTTGRSLLDFFQVSSPEAWKRHLASNAALFRRHGKALWKPEAASVWLALGRRRAQEIQAPAYDAETFDKTLRQLRQFTVNPPEPLGPVIRERCLQAGVIVLFEPAFPRSGMKGATFRLDGKAVLMVGLGRTPPFEDIFWFTFFHEAAHILRHSARHTFLEGDIEDAGPRESEADAFAADLLIPPEAYRAFRERHDRPDERDIRRFAADIRVSPAIVLGRLQHDGVLPYAFGHHLRRRLRLV